MPMSRLKEIVLAFVLEDVAKRLDKLEKQMAGKAEKAALDELKKSNDARDEAIAKLEAWVAAEDENDASAIRAEVNRSNEQSNRINAMVGMPVNQPGTVIDGTSGQPMPAEPGENPASPGEPSSENS